MTNLVVLIILTILLSGCASAPMVARTYPLPRAKPTGLYHRVAEGETLWRISKAYNVDIGAVARANRLSNPSKIDAGQLLFIPEAAQKIKVRTKTPASKISEKGFVWPVKGKVFSYFGQKRHNVTNQGIDILLSKNAIVVASKDGVVSFEDDKVKGFGKTIIIDHGRGISTVYAYNSKNFVRAGDRVVMSQPIAEAGKGSRSDKYMLHFEVRKNKKSKNPFYYLP